MAEKNVAKGKEKEKEPEAKVPVRVQAARPVARGWDLERFFDDFFRLGWPRWWAPERRLFGGEAFIQPPAIDVVDEKNEVVVKAEVPGLSKDDITVELTESSLIIRGEKKREKEVKEENYYRSEREYGSVYRSIELPVPVKPQDVKATFKDGVLEIRMPKTEVAKPKSVKVRVQ